VILLHSFIHLLSLSFPTFATVGITNFAYRSGEILVGGFTERERSSLALYFRKSFSLFIQINFYIGFSILIMKYVSLISIQNIFFWLINWKHAFNFHVMKFWYELLRLRQISIIFAGFRFLENFNLGNFDLFLWYELLMLSCW
jgi:hypothetical protein